MSLDLLEIPTIDLDKFIASSMSAAVADTPAMALNLLSFEWRRTNLERGSYGSSYLALVHVGSTALREPCPHTLSCITAVRGLVLNQWTFYHEYGRRPWQCSATSTTKFCLITPPHMCSEDMAGMEIARKGEGKMSSILRYSCGSGRTACIQLSSLAQVSVIFCWQGAGTRKTVCPRPALLWAN